MKPHLFLASLLSCAAVTVTAVLLAFASLSETNPFKAAGLGASFLAFATLMMLVTVSLVCVYIELVRR
ncbi:MAG: hypothetical protein QXK12_08475 [Candidatus Nezhaarchaeales archaeon]